MKLINQLTAIVIMLGVAGMADAAPADKEARKAERAAKNADRAKNPERAANRKANKGDRVAGTIAKIDGKTITVSSVGRKAAAADVTVQINNATAINVNGQTGTANDLKPGMRIQVLASGGVASEIRVGGGKARGEANPNKPKRDPNAPKANKKNKNK